MVDYQNYEPEGLEGNEDAEILNYARPVKEEDKESAEIGIIRELSPKKVLEQLRMNLKGFFWDYEKKCYIEVKGYQPLMNDKGIAKYLSIMSAVITDLVTFSNYKDEEINRLTLYVCDKAIPTIHVNYREYGIHEKCDLDIIDIQIFNLTLAAFKKAVGSGDRNVIRNVTSENIMQRSGFSQTPSQKQQGFLSRINPFTRGG